MTVNEKTKKVNSLHKVTKSNDLIETSYKLSLQEQRIMSTLISMVEPTDEHFQLYKFTVKEFADMCGIKGKIYSYIKTIVTGLQEKTVTIPSTNGKSTLVVNWLASAEYFDQEGYVELEISSKLKPYLLNLKERFTSYQLQYALTLGSTYSTRIYELLKQYQFMKHKTRTVELETLREWLGFINEDKGKYKQYGHFKAKVLNIAKRDINQKTDLEFDFDEVKDGRKVVAIKFTIKPKSKEKEKALRQEQIQFDIEVDEKPKKDKKGDTLKDELKKKLKELEVKEGQIEWIVNDFPTDQVERNIKYVESRINTIKDNLGGYTYNAIKGDYAASERKQVNKKKVTKEEKMSPTLKDIQTKEEIRKHGTLEQKQKLYHEEFKSVVEFENNLLQVEEYYKMLREVNEDMENMEEMIEKEIYKKLLDDYETRTKIELQPIRISEFKDEKIQRLQENIVYGEKFPAKSY